MTAPAFRCDPDQSEPRREVAMTCSARGCGKALVLINPTPYELDGPLCPLCEIASFEGVTKLLGLTERHSRSSASPETIATEEENTNGNR